MTTYGGETITDLSELHRKLLDLDPDALRCPQRYFGPIREATPVHYVPELDVYMVTRHQDIVDVARRPELFSNKMAAGPQDDFLASIANALQDPEEAAALQELLARRTALMPEGPILLGADPPEHDRQRALVGKWFSPRTVAKLEDRIRAIAHELVDGFAEAGEVELVTQFAVKLPLIVISETVGVSRDELDTFKRWSDDFVLAIGNSKLSPARVRSMLASQIEFYEYFQERVAERRRAPKDDLITGLIEARYEDYKGLTETEILSVLAQFMVAGNETSTKMIASAMLLLLTNPGRMEEVLADHTLLGGVVEEALRLESPVQGLFRVANADTEVAGVPIPAGARLMLCYASGNRDAAVFPDPDAFDPSRRDQRRHLAFGQGVHYCVGASLSRAEGKVGLEVLLTRLGNLRLAPQNTFEYDESFVLHGVKRLHLLFD